MIIVHIANTDTPIAINPALIAWIEIERSLVHMANGETLWVRRDEVDEMVAGF